MANSAYERGSVFNSLTAFAVTGAVTGDSCEFAFDMRKAGLPKDFVWQLLVAGTGSFTSYTALLEGSLNGTSWFTLDSSTAPLGEARFVVNRPVKFLRVRFTAAVVASLIPTVTAMIAAA